MSDLISRSALMKFALNHVGGTMGSKEKICRVNGAPCNECIAGAPCAKMAGGKR